MIKVSIDDNSWYPVYTCHRVEEDYKPYLDEVRSIKENELKEIQHVFNEFERVQKRLKELYGEG